MPRRPFTPEARTVTDSADAPVDGLGHQFGKEVDQSDYASLPSIRLVWSVPRNASVVPKGDTIRTLSARGFNPTGADEGHRRRSR